MSSRLPSILTGMETWPWYIGYLRDPLTCMAAARDKFGPLCALASPLPFHARGRRFVLASGGAINRQVLGQPDLFRPGGQVLRGPKGSAHARLRNGIFAMYGEEHRRTRRLMQPPFIKPAMAG